MGRRKARAAERRSYQQFCGVARALDVVGERWTLLIVRNLLLGPRRYGDLLAELPGLTTNLLAKRLKELEGAGVIEWRDARADGGAMTYALTARGLALDPVITELGRWGWPLMDKPRRGDLVDLGLGMLSLRRRYGGGLSLTVGLTAGARAFTWMLSPTQMIVHDEPAQRPQLTLAAADEDAVRALFFRGVPADALLASGALVLGGDVSTWPALRAAFGV